MSISSGGEEPCPYHRQVLVKWEVRGHFSFGSTPKAFFFSHPKEAWGKVECRARGDNDRCQIDLEPCPIEQIIESIILQKTPPDRVLEKIDNGNHSKHKLIKSSSNPFLSPLVNEEKAEYAPDLSRNAYEDIQKPLDLIEVEGRCPLCGTVMYETKSESYNGHLYSFSFPIYICNSHYHGYFRWLGGQRGHVRILFPQIFRFGKIIGKSEADYKIGLITTTCEDCGFTWKELEKPARTETYCPQCRMRIDLPEVKDSPRLSRQTSLDDVLG